MEQSDIIRFLKKNIPFLRDFSEMQFAELLDNSKISPFEKNQVLIEFGEEGRFLGILIAGELGVSVKDISGEKHTVAVLKPGDIFGEMSLMTGDKTKANIIGLKKGDVLLIPQSFFETILSMHPPTIKFFSKMISERMKDLGLKEKEREITKTAPIKHLGPIPIEVSAHHVHLAQNDLEAIFGQGAQLTPEFELSQPGQYACKETVSLIGPKGRIERVRILGPVRKDTQVEVAMTEQFILGIKPPIRESGDIKESPGITIAGPKGTITIKNGVICAFRHVHIAPEDALRFGLKDKDIVMVKVEGDRELIFGDVIIRVNPNFRLALHIDTDEANAANIKTGAEGYIIGVQKSN